MFAEWWSLSKLPFRMLYTLPDREDITSQPSISQIDWQRSKRKLLTRKTHMDDWPRNILGFEMHKGP
jgi:hypothetical protein